MVCLGNICRSPLAQGILESKIISEDVFVDSAGTASYHEGNSPDKRSIDVAFRYNIDISHQKARKFNISDFDTFDYIYTMDMTNYQNVLMLARNKNDEKKVKLILNEVYPEENRSVPDPYYGGDDGFENVFQMLNKACDVLVKKYNNANAR